MSCAIVVSTLTLLEIIFLIVVLVQSAHVDKALAEVIFQALLVQNGDVIQLEIQDVSNVDSWNRPSVM